MIFLKGGAAGIVRQLAASAPNDAAMDIAIIQPKLS
jgi:hypothetical protein